ncbi:UDP-N-acetylglucosamine 1-carboxyvinyltransferase [Desulforamulus reducens MI-1]|uniref:UDP-N-acetylglucosamine 1-carboxyvinyltransferase n=1 Tax=Desulforamulus reducens (strain ATCC BAA-1160 / DSM 100696 / MI-1) TaxID=349161 RepID=A4J997_DESRM|nr:UDP-N-acetylglucosamine 1-carboxyvinyltransferase [Desulforamulus reducens]ABO51650.1 UDP-N-acetylglucosamine 1-carboxyvinyltransferase [Desulforamulus reducens MI-1]
MEEKIIISGGRPLTGSIRVSGAKNAVLPILAASLLTTTQTRLLDVPDLADVGVICSVLQELGTRIEKTKEELVISIPSLQHIEAPYEYVRKMRASFLVMGPLLAREGRARISLPGGCAIGTRPIDLHLKGFSALGADIRYGSGHIEAVAKELTGADIYLDFPSVGATENIMMAAVLARGQTTIENAAEEPEIVDLANFLNAMGAKIKGAGTKVIRINGVKELTGTTHAVIPDRIEAGTYLVAAAMTRGDVMVENVIADHLKPVVAKLKEAGAEIKEEETHIQVCCNGILKGVDIKTLPYPGFPTDMQAQFMTLMAVAEGTSIITETVFENRFMHVNELKRMGAKIKIEGRTAIVQGVKTLNGAAVKATDLRAGAAMILAGLTATGETEVANIHHIDRGYERLIEKLQGIGANIRRVEVKQ